MSGPRFAAAVELPDEGAALPVQYRALAVAAALRALAAEVENTPSLDPERLSFVTGTGARVELKAPAWPEPGAPAPATPPPLGKVRDGLTPATGLPFEAIPTPDEEPAGPRAVLAAEERAELRTLAARVLDGKPLIGDRMRMRRLAELAARAAQEPAEDALAFSGPIADKARKEALRLLRSGICEDAGDIPPGARVTGGEPGAGVDVYFVEARMVVPLPAKRRRKSDEDTVRCERCGVRPAVVEESRLCAECERQGAKLRDSTEAMELRADRFIVVCREDRERDRNGLDASGSWKPAPYTLATRTVFATGEAAGRYAKGIDASREPLVVPGDWRGLRFDEERGR